MTSTILKTFGTGQVTIPKQWRLKMKSEFYYAIFDEENWKITFSPIVKNDESSSIEDKAFQITSVNSTNKEWLSDNDCEDLFN